MQDILINMCKKFHFLRNDRALGNRKSDNNKNPKNNNKNKNNVRSHWEPVCWSKNIWSWDISRRVGLLSLYAVPSIVREYVFYVFLKIQKDATFYVFLKRHFKKRKKNVIQNSKFQTLLTFH